MLLCSGKGNIMAKLIYKGLKASLPTERNVDSFYLCTDTRELYFGNELYTEPVRFYETTKPESPAQGVLYVDTTTGSGDVWNGKAWSNVIKPLVTTISDDADDSHVPSAKAVKDYTDNKVQEIAGQVEGLGALASKDKVEEADLEETLATKLNSKADASQVAEDIVDAKTELIGTDGDTGTNDTIKGAKKYADEQIAAQIASVYKAGGSVAFAGLAELLTKANEGKVYNITDAFTTDDTFVEGTGKKHPVGTNVVCVDTGDEAYKWDVLAGFVDLSIYDTAEVANGKIEAAKQEAISTAAEDATSKANAAQSTAQAYADTKISEAKTELIGNQEGITATTIKDGVVEAKTHADGLNTTMDSRMKAVEDALTVGSF